MVQKTVLNNSSNRNELLSKAVENRVIKKNDFDTTIDIPKIVRKRIQKNNVWNYTDVSHKICRKYGGMFLEYDRDDLQVSYTEGDRQAFVNAVKLACDYVKDKHNRVSITMVLEALKNNNVIIIDRQVLSIIVKKYLIDNPNPKRISMGKKGYNRVRHNNTLLGQECPVNNNTISKRSFEFQKKLYSLSA